VCSRLGCVCVSLCVCVADTAVCVFVCVYQTMQVRVARPCLKARQENIRRNQEQLAAMLPRVPESPGDQHASGGPKKRFKSAHGRAQETMPATSFSCR
jgi:hypothetical protein